MAKKRTLAVRRLGAITGRTQTRTIRRRVLSPHTELVVVASKIAAVHHERSGFRRLATAFGPTASVGTQATGREF